MADNKKPAEKQSEELVNVFCEYERKHVLMTHEKSLRDLIKHHDACDYGVPTEIYLKSKESKEFIDGAVKRTGYKPVLDEKGKHSPMSGIFYFRFTKPVV